MEELKRRIIELSKGNPGALTFLISLLEQSPVVGLIVIISLEEQFPSIRGTNIYVLYSDLCGRDIEKVLQLMANCPPEILEDACSRQDYSGRALVAPYL